jgi:hypothetical protein
MAKIVEIEIREYYGKERAYPANDIAKTFASLANTKSFSIEALAHIQRLGFTVQRRAKLPSVFEREIEAVTGRVVATGPVVPVNRAEFVADTSDVSAMSIPQITIEGK